MTKLFNEDARFNFKLFTNWEEVTDEDESIYSFIRSEEPIGALQISLFKKNNEQAPDKKECLNSLAGYLQRKGLNPKINISKSGFVYRGDAEVCEGDVFLMIWLFVNSKRHAFITYNCQNNLKNKEISEVKKMVHSFKLL